MKYILLTLCLLLVVAGCTQPIVESESSTPEIRTIINEAYIARDIPFYTQDASLIVIGTVKSIDNSDVTININEVLKGDPSLTTLTIFVDDRIVDGVNFISDEKVLLFIGKTTEGKYVVYAGPYGKYLINDQEIVTSAGDFEMSLEDLKTEIKNSISSSDFAIYYTFGVGEKNLLNSANNLYVKDMICDESKEYTLILTDEEKQEIQRLIILSSFFDLEEGHEQEGEIQVMCSPSYTMTLTITMNGKTHTVHREECAGGDGDIRSITEALNQIIQEYEQKMEILALQCGYV